MSLKFLLGCFGSHFQNYWPFLHEIIIYHTNILSSWVEQEVYALLLVKPGSCRFEQESPGTSLFRVLILVNLGSVYIYFSNEVDRKQSDLKLEDVQIMQFITL
jgi:hypothetical protein